MNRSEVGDFLTVSQDVVDALVREAMLLPLPRNGRRIERFFIRDDVLSFADTHVLAAPLARSLGVQSAWLQRDLNRLGVAGRAINYRYATTVLYRKDEILQHIRPLNKT